MPSPYANLPDHRYWRRAMSRVEGFAVDPVVQRSFGIARTDRVATAGSCFAQHISRSLAALGYGYWIAEPAPAGMSDGEARRLNYGVFSCRYGNIYTTRQLLQLIIETFDGQRDVVWQREDGRYVDALRPQISVDGYSRPEDVTRARTKHLDAVRRMFENANVFVFTLGLTECWRSKSDGVVYPLAPGVVAGSYDGAEHEFVNLSVTDVEQDLAQFHAHLRSINPRCRVILTVSPVPLIATFENRHVLVSTTYSKSVLRVAAQTAADTLPDVDYFPSFEIVTGNHAGGRYFENDLREVNSLGVAHAMRVFVRHYVGDSDGYGAPHRFDSIADNVRVEGRPHGTDTAIIPTDDVVCDEEAIELVRA